MTPLLEARALSRRFGGLRAVDDLSFGVAAGEILGLIGPNGAGKTTVVNLVSGMIGPSGGRVTFDGRDVTGLAPSALARRGLVRTFQNTTVYARQTVRENALRGSFMQAHPGFVHDFFGTARARRLRAETADRVAALLDDLGLLPLAGQVAGSLPYGTQKALGIGIALATQPRLIMLDEPVAGLSGEEANQMRDVVLKVRKRGITVVVIDHNMRFISGLCDRVLVVHHGQELAQGSPQEVLSSPAVIEAYLGRGHGAARY